MSESWKVDGSAIGGTERCDGCHEEFLLSDIEYKGQKFLCVECRAKRDWDPAPGGLAIRGFRSGGLEKRPVMERAWRR